jgi:chromosome segregation ATPase
LNAIANIKAIEFQINHLNSMTTGFTDQLNEKDAEIAHLQSQLNAIDHANEAQLTALQQQIAGLQEANATLTENFNKFKTVLTSIDQMTDEVIS